ncbi:MocR-like pyridoxine biosynthesis transcription factor PdxR [Azospirillum canadense]|uniref:MocR-like pyridoxine biosynthesis transcription factor PdxR n=1 Tax=Azospirillum canadense TaxID=403962 RepID=UPI0022271FA1|nr:PLP-dependent aminotransferase family protein [Azospirillum canadense]MCW2241447.1 GntR family transcriptional regulator/MocR family aminotransferase [Azospirillum canadense]
MVHDHPLTDVLAGLDRTAEEPLFRQLFGRLRGAILSGRLAPGCRFPSSRGLAAQLSLSRATVQTAYDLLASEGMIVGRAGAGTTVAPAMGLGTAADFPSPVPQPSLRGGHGTAVPLFQPGLPALDAFPRKLWSRLVSRRVRSLAESALGHLPPEGFGPLREEIATYLRIARGVTCDPEQVFVTSGFRGALALIARALPVAGRPVWVEDPGFPQTRTALECCGALPVPVPVDAHGLDVAAARRSCPDAAMAVLTPAHQFPRGCPLSLERRWELLAWAARDAWIIEDDYDSEYRYGGPPLPALAGLDRGGRVLYVGTFSKVLFPALRLGYLVVPRPELARFRQVRTLLEGHPPPLDQMALADFLAQGHFSRHIQRMRRLYRQRRDALAAALERHMASFASIEVPAGGLHLILRFRDGRDDRVAAGRLGACGLAGAPLSACFLKARPESGLILGFANLPTQRAEESARQLRRALEDDECARRA